MEFSDDQLKIKLAQEMEKIAHEIDNLPPIQKVENEDLLVQLEEFQEKEHEMREQLMSLAKRLEGLKDGGYRQLAASLMKLNSLPKQ